jgi:hypothetical protein
MGGCPLGQEGNSRASANLRQLPISSFFVGNHILYEIKFAIYEIPPTLYIIFANETCNNAASKNVEMPIATSMLGLNGCTIAVRILVVSKEIAILLQITRIALGPPLDIPLKSNFMNPVPVIAVLLMLK